MASVTQGSDGSVAINSDSTVIYTPNPNFIGTDQFTYSISDGRAGTDTANVMVTVNTPPNQPPVAVDDATTTTENTAVVIAVLANDTDPDGDPLAVVSVTQGANGAVTLAANLPTYVPATDFVGPDTFTYTISDGQGGTNTATVSVTVNPRPPSLTAFTPTSGSAGTNVTLTGTGLGTTTGVTIGGVEAPFTVLSSTQVIATIPSGAASGPIHVTTPGGRFSTPGHYVVLPSPDFTLSGVPAAATTPQEARVNYLLSVTGVDGFTGLVSLSVNALPSGVTAQFTAPALTTGQSTVLTLITSATTPVGLATFTVTGSAVLGASPRTQSVPLTLEVTPGGRTSLAGQFLTNDEAPIPNVRVGLGTVETQTDGAGNFLLVDVPAGLQQLQIDANAARAGFPIYNVDVTLVASETTVLPPFHITPPPSPERFTPINNATADQVITDPRFPGVEVTLPKGVTIVGWDGLPKTKIALDRFTPDRLPMLPPPFPTRSLYRIHFGTPMGGIPNARLPIALPNDQNLEPGEKAGIWYYDAAPLPGAQGTWRLAGLGTVSADGTRIVSDPGVGIERFCGVCGVSCIDGRGQGQDNNNPNSPAGGDPVNLAMGQFLPTKTDLVLPGRLSIQLTRTYNPFDPFGKVAGFELGLGPGWALSVDMVLLEVSASLRHIILPGNSRFAFVRQPDGTFANTTHPLFAGAVLTAEAGGAHRLRFKDGFVWRFAAGWGIAGLGLLVEQADRNGNRITIERDPSGRLFRVVDPAGRALTFSLDSSGRIIEIGDPLGNTTRVTYHTSGEMATVVDPLGNILGWDYDSVSRMVRQTDPRGAVTRFKYDDLNRLTSIIDALSESTALTYDPNGNLLTVADARGNSTAYEYDSMDRRKRRIDPLGAAETFTYDPVGNLIESIDRKGQRSGFTYDPLNQLVKWEVADGTFATFTYDMAGRLRKIDDTSDPHRPIILDYDLLDRVEAETTATSTVRYGYDGLGRRTQMTVGGQAPVTYTYDANSRLRTITQSSLDPVTIDYDSANRRTFLTLPNGLSTEYRYDSAYRLTGLIYRNAFGLVGELLYRYDALGNRIAVGGSLARTLLPDPVPNATYDAANRQRTFGTKTMTYDPNGNLETVTEVAGTTTFMWDPLNRLSSFNAPAVTGTFAYDGRGRRVRRDIGGEVLEYHYDNVDIIGELGPRGEVAYLRTLDIDQVIWRIEPGGITFYLADALGSTLAQTDGDGRVVAAYTYAPFGRTETSGTPSPNPFQFTGRENDGTSLYYYRARYYGPQLQRFTGEDPIGFAGGDWNLYTYLANSPLNRGDATGEQGGAAEAAAGGFLVCGPPCAVAGAVIGLGTAAALGYLLSEATNELTREERLRRIKERNRRQDERDRGRPNKPSKADYPPPFGPGTKPGSGQGTGTGSGSGQGTGESGGFAPLGGKKQ